MENFTAPFLTAGDNAGNKSYRFYADKGLTPGGGLLIIVIETNVPRPAIGFH
jgi:hypothetical protein